MNFIQGIVWWIVWAWHANRYNSAVRRARRAARAAKQCIRRHDAARIAAAQHHFHLIELERRSP